MRYELHPDLCSAGVVLQTAAVGCVWFARDPSFFFPSLFLFFYTSSISLLNSGLASGSVLSRGAVTSAAASAMGLAQADERLFAILRAILSSAVFVIVSIVISPFFAPSHPFLSLPISDSFFLPLPHSLCFLAI